MCAACPPWWHCRARRAAAAAQSVSESVTPRGERRAGEAGLPPAAPIVPRARAAMRCPDRQRRRRRERRAPLRRARLSSTWGDAVSGPGPPAARGVLNPPPSIPYPASPSRTTRGAARAPRPRRALSPGSLPCTTRPLDSARTGSRAGLPQATHSHTRALARTRTRTHLVAPDHPGPEAAPVVHRRRCRHGPNTPRDRGGQATWPGDGALAALAPGPRSVLSAPQRRALASRVAFLAAVAPRRAGGAGGGGTSPLPPRSRSL